MLIALAAFTANYYSAYSQSVYNWAINPGGPSDEMGYGVANDANGNTYVTGYFQGTANFNPAGSANLTSHGGQDIFLAKYSPTGAYLWAIGIGSTNSDIGWSVAADGTGAYISGEFHGSADFDPGPGTTTLVPVGGASDIDIFFAHYDASGNFVWAKSIGSSGSDRSYGIAVDASSNAYITGTFGGGTADFDPGVGTANLTTNGVNTDLFFAKYNSSGSYVWAKSIGSTGSDIGHAITLDATGTVYLTGEYSGSADFDPGAGIASMTPVGNMDVFFAKYTSDGLYTWAKSIGGISADIGYGITVDGSGNVYITGIFNATVDFNPASGTLNLTSAGSTDVFFGKYTSAGLLTWAKNIGGTTTDQANGIAVDASGNVYVAGFFWATADFDPGPTTINMTAVGNYDGFFAKYSSTGNYSWSTDIGSTSFDYANAITADASCNIYVTGTFNNTADFDPGATVANLTSHGSYDVFVAKYACTLLPITLLYFKASCRTDNSIILSWGTASEVNNDRFVIERSKNGNEFDSIAEIQGKGISIVQENYSFIDQHPVSGINFYRLKQVDYNGAFVYSAVTNAVVGNAQLILKTYPNPVSAVLSCDLFLPQEEIISFRLTDILGRVQIEKEESFPAGFGCAKLRMDDLPEGTYMLSIRSETKEVTVEVFKL